MTVTETSRPTKRAELAAFLKARRARISPEQAGLAPGPRRRTPGLRREEVAQLAGVGVTWYTWLEQGRPINVSTQVLDAVARVLELGPAEVWHLYRLAELPGVPMPPRMPETLSPEAVQVLDQLDPKPACIYNARYDLIANNAAYALLFPYSRHATGIERNVFWQVANSPDALQPLNPELFGRLVATFRLNYSRHVGEPAWEDLIAELNGSSALFRSAWASHEVAAPGPQLKQFACPPVGTIRLNTLSYTIDGAAELRMVVHIPESSADAARIEELGRIGGVRFK